MALLTPISIAMILEVNLSTRQTSEKISFLIFIFKIDKLTHYVFIHCKYIWCDNIRILSRSGYQTTDNNCVILSSLSHATLY